VMVNEAVDRRQRFRIVGDSRMNRPERRALNIDKSCVQITPISRTVGQGRIIDEFIVSFTHDVEMPALLPGIAPTGRKVTLPHVVVMGIVNGKVAQEHIYWDQASLLVQVGLLDPAKLPVVGAEQGPSGPSQPVRSTVICWEGTVPPT
jgi:hypothetical protein